MKMTPFEDEKTDEFEVFIRRRRRLETALGKCKALFSSIGLEESARKMAELSDQLVSGTFKVLVMGEFKRGKSTFINALLGEEVLPADPVPCTAIINIIRYGETKSAKLFFHPYDPSKLPLMSEKARVHVVQLREKDGAIPPMEIDVSAISDYVVIEDPGKDQSESVSESPYSHIEICWPLRFCRNGVEIIDSPGLNENKTRTTVTTNYAPSSDAVIFVLSSHAVAGASEASVIENLRASGHESLFFVINRFDEIRSRDREKIVDFATKKLSPLTSLGAKGLHFVSSLAALEAKTDPNGRALPPTSVDYQRLGSSGFPELEACLEEYLVCERGRIKLIRPLRIARKHLIDAIGKNIPMQISMYGMEVEEIRLRYEKALPKLSEAKASKAKIMLDISNGLAALKDDMRREIELFIKDKSNDLQDMLAGYEPTSKIKIFRVASLRRQCEDLAKELLKVIECKMAAAQRTWVDETLAPEFEKRVKRIFDSSELAVSEFLKTVDDVRLSFTENVTESEQREVGGVERILAAGAAYFLLSPGAMFQAGMYGFGGLIKAILPQLGVFLALSALGIANPLVWIGAFLGAGFLQALIGVQNAEDKVKEELCKKAAAEMRASASATANAAVKAIVESLEKIKSEFEKGMDAEIYNVEKSVTEVLDQKNRSQCKADEKIASLNAALDECRELAKSLDDIEHEIDTMAS